MAFAKKPYKPKRETVQETTAMFPSLHEDFNLTGGDDEAIEHYPTYIMGRFECRNKNCSKNGWGSKKIFIIIRRFPGNGYNAVVYKQCCKSCDKLGTMRIDENSYVERVAYRLKKWAGISMDTPEYNGPKVGPEHESDFCEGCKEGYCQRGGFRARVLQLV
ncbi:zinc-binding domain-containing protein [Chaetomidium leptoderma]|uniref:Zinc-binding domain-containing protein n=1 Tax=Chaetomidium leptoderma TaxID=669021 RepID=A0AAN6VR47_9PEZI|nr:zinc-binding domain-containing protein [Chaetomidium leptoderma]